MAKKKKSKVSLTVVKTLVVMVLALTVGIFICKGTYSFFVHSDYFKIKSVIIDSSLSFIERQELGNLSGKSIFGVDLKKVQKHLAFKYPQVSDLRVVRRFPNQVHIQAKPRHRFAQTRSGNNILTIDEKGIVLSSSSERDEALPFIATDHSEYLRYTLGAPLNSSDHIIALEIIRAFVAERALSAHEIDRIDMESLSKIDVYLDDDFHILFDANKIDQKVRVLGLLLAQGKVDPREVKYVDLRFKEPIVGKK